MSAWLGLDPGLSKCGLVLADEVSGRVVAAGVLSPDACLAQIQSWQSGTGLEAVVLGNGTGSKHWQQQLSALELRVQVIPEAGTTWPRARATGSWSPRGDGDDCCRRVCAYRPGTTTMWSRNCCSSDIGGQHSSAPLT